MTKYNFHYELDNIKKNPKYVLPVDINKPVFDFLEKIKCELGVKKLKAMQLHLNYGRIVLRRNDLSNVVLEIQVDCGMAGDWEDCETEKDDVWTATTYKTVKNYNLTKRKPTKG